MKFIGQYIQRFIARFRNDVYLEELSTTTETNVLVVDSTGKVSKSTTLADDIIESEIDTLAGLTSFGAAGATTDIAAGDVTMYNAVNNGNPTISLGSSATNRFEIQAIYNSGAQTLDEVAFQSYTTDGSTSDGRFKYYIDEVLTFKIADNTAIVYGDFYSDNSNGFIRSNNQASSSTTGGGKLILQADDGAAMADNHRLGVIEFKGAEDASNTRSIGARIDAVCRDAWDGSNNDADLEFYTTNATTESKVLTLNADGNVVTTGNIELGHVTDTTIARSASGTVTIEGKKIITEDKQRWIKNTAFVATMSTTETFIPMVGSAENTSIQNGSMAMIMPCAGTLTKLYLKTQRDHSGVTTTIKMYNVDENETHGTSAFTSLGVQSATGPATNDVGVFDFTSSLDSGTNAFTAGEMIALSIQNSSAVSSSCKYFVTAVFELDYSTLL